MASTASFGWTKRTSEEIEAQTHALYAAYIALLSLFSNTGA